MIQDQETEQIEGHLSDNRTKKKEYLLLFGQKYWATH